MTLEIKNGDCLKYMAELPAKSIDLFICDLPYGETNCKWDSVINLEEFWKQFKRLRKSKKTLCIHFCSTKFGYSLIKSNEKMFKMDMVWKKRNKTGGLQSRYRPMRNHEMVYFFYEQAPKYNRDKYHKRIIAKPKLVKKEDSHQGLAHPEGVINLGTGAHFEPIQPASVLCDRPTTNLGLDGSRPTTNIITKPKKEVCDMDKTTDAFKNGECHAELGSKYKKEHRSHVSFKPTQIGSFVTDEDLDKPKNVIECKEGFGFKTGKKAFGASFEPPHPASVLEGKTGHGWDKAFIKENGNKIGTIGGAFDPKLPASVIDCPSFKAENYNNNLEKRVTKLEEAVFKHKVDKAWDIDNSTAPVIDKWIKEAGKNGHGYDKHKPEYGNSFDPKQPGSIVENDETLDLFDFIEDAENAPYSVYASKKCFIGKRNHQTEKPLDILEFFLKYWSDEKDTILDPTMGSGSTGVACAKLNRNFIGYEMDEKIFKVAENRIKNKK